MKKPQKKLKMENDENTQKNPEKWEELPKFYPEEHRGNPNIGEISKKKSTGPRTLEGLWRGAVLSGRIKTGTYSRLLKKVRKCSVCPLRPREVTIRGQTITTQPRCSLYNPDPKHKCPVGAEEFIERSRIYYEFLEKNDINQLMAAIALEQQARSQIAEQVEIVEKGHPGFYALEYSKAAADILDRVQKNTQGEKRINVNVDATQKFLQEVFRMPEDEEQGGVGEDGKS